MEPQLAVTEPVIPNGTELINPKVEAKVDSPAVPTQPKDLTSSRFAALAKKETALVREKAAIKAEREIIAREKEEAKKLVEAQKLAISNPLKAMELLGISYKQLTEFVLNDEKPTPEIQARTLKEELKSEWQKELEERDKKAEEARRLAREKEEADVEVQFKTQTTTWLSNEEGKKKFPLINHPKNDMPYTVDVITAVIKSHYADTEEKDPAGVILKPGKLLSVSEAAQMYEDHLRELTKEFSATIMPKSDGQEDPKQSQEKVHEPRTITNQMQSGLATKLPAKTEQDRFRRALEKLSG